MDKLTPNHSLTLLAVLAHPDDESFGMGGTLALYARRGVAVHLVCATRGEAGSLDADCLDGFDSVADRRVSELRCAAGVLGLAGVHFLDYRDSGMPGSPDNVHPDALAFRPVDEVAARVADHIRSLRPQVVLTFDPIGGYKHPDHIAIHHATRRAIDLAADPAFEDGLPPHRVQKLYYHIIPKGMLKAAVTLLSLVGRDPRKFGRNGDIDLKALVEEGDFPVHAAIDIRRVMDKKDAASACHESQLGGGVPRRGVWSWIVRQISGQHDLYMRAAPPPAPRQRKEKDLFQGIA